MEKAVSPYLVFDESGDLYVFNSFDQMRDQLEGVDVDAGVYEAFDSLGNQLRVGTAGVTRGSFIVDVGKLTHIEVASSDPAGRERLIELLVRHLTRAGNLISQTETLEALIAMVCSEGESRKGT